MKKNVLFLSISLVSLNITAQVFIFSSEETEKSITHKVLLDSDYFIETQYITNSNEFVSTRGGFYELKEGMYLVRFEFNSNFSSDSLKTLNYKSTKWKQSKDIKQDHSGKWLMAGRVRDGVEKRRTTSGARKTLKFLLNGHFQWTAFNVVTFKFNGSGGGTYTSKEGDYIETITYFSKDNSRVGAVLPFRYNLKGLDWHHQGLNSKGKLMYEIWTKREN